MLFNVMGGGGFECAVACPFAEDTGEGKVAGEVLWTMKWP